MQPSILTSDYKCTDEHNNISDIFCDNQVSQYPYPTRNNNCHYNIRNNTHCFCPAVINIILFIQV